MATNPHDFSRAQSACSDAVAEADMLCRFSLIELTVRTATQLRERFGILVVPEQTEENE